MVADEVRNLASKSAEAAKSTTALIEASVLSIGDGVAIAHKTERDLQNIVDETNATQVRVLNISKASEEQAKALKRISSGVTQITAVIHNNSATSEESAASSEELSSQANLMKAYISRFKVKSTEDIMKIRQSGLLEEPVAEEASK